MEQAWEEEVQQVQRDDEKKDHMNPQKPTNLRKEGQTSILNIIAGFIVALTGGEYPLRFNGLRWPKSGVVGKQSGWRS